MCLGWENEGVVRPLGQHGDIMSPKGTGSGNSGSDQQKVS